jgi:hypothetical protein
MSFLSPPTKQGVECSNGKGWEKTYPRKSAISAKMYLGFIDIHVYSWVA